MVITMVTCSPAAHAHLPRRRQLHMEIPCASRCTRDLHAASVQPDLCRPVDRHGMAHDLNALHGTENVAPSLD